MLDVDALIEEATAVVKAAEDNFSSFCDGRSLQGDVFARLLRVHPLLEEVDVDRSHGQENEAHPQFVLGARGSE